jgi:hypothetical protein
MNMTLTERKTNPAITAMFVETLTQPEMEKVSGGSIGDDIETFWNVSKCEVFGSHNWGWTGEWTDIDTAWYTTGHKVMVCTRCGRTKTDGEVYVIINRKNNKSQN